MHLSAGSATKPETGADNKRYLTHELLITPTGTFHCSPPLLLPHPSGMKAPLSCLSVAWYRLISPCSTGELQKQRCFNDQPFKAKHSGLGLSQPSKNPLTNHSLARRCQLAGHFLQFGTVSLWLAPLWSQHKHTTGTKGSPPRIWVNLMTLTVGIWKEGFHHLQREGFTGGGWGN